MSAANEESEQARLDRYLEDFRAGADKLAEAELNQPEEERSEHWWRKNKQGQTYCARCRQTLDQITAQGEQAYWLCPIETAEFNAYMKSHEHE